MLTLPPTALAVSDRGPVPDMSGACAERDGHAPHRNCPDIPSERTEARLVARRTVMVCVTLFKASDGGFGVMPSAEFDGDPSLVIHDYDRFGIMCSSI